VLSIQGHWLFGTLVQNLFSVAGPSKRPDVNQMLMQPFGNYNMRTSGRRSRKDCSLRKASCEHRCAVLSKRGVSGRHNKLVRKIRHDVSVPKAVRECRHEKQKRSGRVISSKEPAAQAVERFGISSQSPCSFVGENFPIANRSCSFRRPGYKRFDVLDGDLAMSATIISSDCGATARSRGSLRLRPHF
jgi:hypothetical protein